MDDNSEEEHFLSRYDDSETKEPDDLDGQHEESAEIEEGEWGGEENQIIYTDIRLLPLLLGTQNTLSPEMYAYLHDTAATLQPTIMQQQQLVRAEKRKMDSPPRKILRDENGNRIENNISEKYKYLKLTSGEIFEFTDEDGKKLILNERIEPNRLIRNIISKIPTKLSNRLEYLSKFTSEEEEQPTEKRYDGELKDAVYGAYIKEWRLRYIFKRVLMLWRIMKMNKAATKDVDPITLSPPEKEVYIYDWQNKRKYVLDARSLANLIETKLLYQEHGFPLPMFAKNPISNVELTYKQYISVYNQLKSHGELRWGLTSLKEYNFNKARWQMYHRSALTINAIKNNLKLLDTFEARELFSDFIFAKMDELNIRVSTYIVNAYQTAMIKVPTHWYLEKCKSLTIAHYETEHFGHHRTRAINTCFIKLMKRQAQFIKELEDKKII
jgi:hypothetical protein